MWRRSIQKSHRTRTVGNYKRPCTLRSKADSGQRRTVARRWPGLLAQKSIYTLSLSPRDSSWHLLRGTLSGSAIAKQISAAEDPERGRQGVQNDTFQINWGFILTTLFQLYKIYSVERKSDVHTDTEVSAVSSFTFAWRYLEENRKIWIRISSLGENIRTQDVPNI